MALTLTYDFTALAIIKTFHGNLADMDAINDSNMAILATQFGKTLLGLSGAGVHGGFSAELFDKDDNSINTVRGNGPLTCLLFPVAAGLDGDNGSDSATIRHNVDPTTFATGKVRLSVGGTSGNTGQFLALCSDNANIVKYLNGITGKGKLIYDIPFTVVA